MNYRQSNSSGARGGWNRRGWIGIAVISGMGWPATGVPGAESAAPLRLSTAADRIVEPLAVASHKAVAFIFVAPDCPIANAYAPEVNRIAADFGARGILFRLVYSDPDVKAPAVRKHLKAFGYTIDALLDPDLALAARLGAKSTPEAFVVDAAGRTLYRGRIDDLFPARGRRRRQPTTHDLRDALAAIAAGTPVRNPVTEAVGCYLPAAKKR